MHDGVTMKQKVDGRCCQMELRNSRGHEGIVSNSRLNFDLSIVGGVKSARGDSMDPFRCSCYKNLVDGEQKGWATGGQCGRAADGCQRASVRSSRCRYESV